MIGKLVMLNLKSIQDFYGTEENTDCYFLSSGKDETNRFLDYVEHITGFENGIGIGEVMGFGYDNNTVRVKFQSPISGKYLESYYGIDELDTIGDIV